MLPLNTHFSGEWFLVEKTSTSWQSIRHALRRVSLLKTYEHPFENVHKKTPAELFRELPEDVKDYVEACPACTDIEDPRVKFTRAVVFWNEYYKDLVERSKKPNEERENWVHGDIMDEFIQAQKPSIMDKFKPCEDANIATRARVLPRVPSSDAETMEMKKPRVMEMSQDGEAASVGSSSAMDFGEDSQIR